MTDVLVTGGSGFIGSAIVRRLAKGGNKVLAPSSSELDLLTATEGDLAQFVEKSGVSYCIHAAWYTNHADYLTHDINREWLAASLRLARACKELRFVGLGTCLEYDLSIGEPCSELATSPKPRTLYARCKRDLSLALFDYDANYAWARIFFVYGRGDRTGRLVSDMLERFSRSEPSGPTFGGLRRDYIHVDDLADQIVRIANSNVRGPINTGTGEAPTLSEIYAAGAAALGRPELAQTNDEIGDQPPRIQANMAYFQRAVGDSEARTIRQGLADLVG